MRHLKAQFIRNYINAENLPIIDWPPYSPDVSPIENVWAVLKMKIRSLSCQNINDLNELINV